MRILATSKTVRFIIIPAIVLASWGVADCAAQQDSDFPALDRQPFSKSGVRDGAEQPLDLDRTDPRTEERERRNSSGRRESEGIPLDPIDEPLDDRVRVPEPGDLMDSGNPPSGDSDSVPAADANSDFDWRVQPVSLADVGVGVEWPFQHRKPNLSDAESAAYAELIQAIMDRKTTVSADVPSAVSVRSGWESAFYRFAEVRRQAWLAGTLTLPGPSRIPLDGLQGSPDPDAPFRTPRTVSDTVRYSLQLDMQSSPADFVGRPVAMYGLFAPRDHVELYAARTLEGEEQHFRMQRGMLRDLQGKEILAIVDAVSYVDPVDQLEPSAAWPQDQNVQIPVLVKGWFIKLWGQQPLVFCEVLRVLTPRPYDAHIREAVVSRRKVTDDESWIYHETLRQLQLTSGSVQAGIALAEQQERLETLLTELKQASANERSEIERLLREGLIQKDDEGTKQGFDSRIRRLDRQLSARLERHELYKNEPSRFPLFVDMFQHPDEWQGKLVTLKGYVRRVITHPGDPAMFQGQPLHELWLFNEHAQHIPTVVVTPELPEDFPVNCDLIQSVSVTGCFFKMYVYRSQEEHRLAPLVLAGRIQWTPTPDQVASLVRSGDLSARSPLVARAQSMSPQRVSDTLILLIGFLAVMTAMTVWARVQREHKERRRVAQLVDERPDFRQTSIELYSGAFADSQAEPTRG